MQTIKIRIWRQRSIIWFKKLCYNTVVPISLLLTWRKKDTDNIVTILEHTKNDIQLMYADGYNKRYYLILAGFIVDYEK